jgi:hypothetical protein
VARQRDATRSEPPRIGRISKQVPPNPTGAACQRVSLILSCLVIRREKDENDPPTTACDRMRPIATPSPIPLPGWPVRALPSAGSSASPPPSPSRPAPASLPPSPVSGEIRTLLPAVARAPNPLPVLVARSPM